MAFTFNWAGVTAPVIQGGSTQYKADLERGFGNAGAAIRGYKIDQANKEYADMLGQYDPIDNNAKIMELMTELRTLEQRNEEIKAQLGG